MQSSHTSSDSAQIKKIEPKQVQKLTLKQILRADPDVRDFYKIIDESDMRLKAIELLEQRISAHITQ